MKVHVDPERCQGHTLCAMIAPDMFELDDVDGHSSPVSEQVPANQEARRTGNNANLSFTSA